MKAYRLTKWLHAGEFQDVPVPEPGPGQALVRIGGAGACHSDLHLMHEWSPETFPAVAEWTLPFTLGHENAGWAEAGDLGGVEPGAPVVIAPTWSCGVCRSCRHGATNYCDQIDVWDGKAGGIGLDGGLAEYMVVPTACLVPLRDLEPWQAAPLTDAGLTSYHAVKRCLPLLTPDVSVVVIGVGGLGHMAVAYLRELCGAQIIAVDLDEGALKLAREMGADICLQSDSQTASEIRKASQGLGAMAVLDFVGANAPEARIFNGGFDQRLVRLVQIQHAHLLIPVECRLHTEAHDDETNRLVCGRRNCGGHHNPASLGMRSETKSQTSTTLACPPRGTCSS